MKPMISLRKALDDPNLLGRTLAGQSWRHWRVLLMGAMGEALNTEERRIFKDITRREREPGQPVKELVAVVGRRGGKSKAVATRAAYLASLCDHRDVLVPGERGVLLVISLSQEVATIVLDCVTR